MTLKARVNSFFLFYSERMNFMWLLTSEEFIKESNQNETVKNSGKRSIWINRKTEH